MTSAEFSRYLNNRIEVSDQPTRRRERHMKRFKSVCHAQKFLSSHSRIHNHFQLRRHRLSAAEYRTARHRVHNLAKRDRNRHRMNFDPAKGVFYPALLT
jgi:hypothetical protein